jgi:hypothetical protein
MDLTAPNLVSPVKLEQLRKDARRVEQTVERSLNDLNRKLLLLKSPNSTIASSSSSSSSSTINSSNSAEQQPLIQNDAFAEAETCAADIELELQANALPHSQQSPQSETFAESGPYQPDDGAVCRRVAIGIAATA